MCSGHFLQSGKEYKEPRGLAVLNDSDHMEVVGEDVQSLAYLYVFTLGVNVVHQNVIGVFQIPACVKDKPAGYRAESFGVDSENVF